MGRIFGPSDYLVYFCHDTRIMPTERQNSRAEPLIPEDAKDQAPAPLDRNSNSTGIPHNDAMAPRQADEEAQQRMQQADENTAIYATLPGHHQEKTYAYWRSAQFVELLFCLAFYVVITVFTAAQPFPTYERPIPYQYLNNAGEIVINQEYNQEKTGSTVSPSVVCLGAIILQLVLSLVRHRLLGKSFYDLHATLCTYLMALALNRIATEWLKNYVGYLRPIFYETCVPDDEFMECTDNDGGGRKSFPSGHASISFTGCMLLMLYIHNRWGMGHYKARLERHRHMLLQNDGNVLPGDIDNAWISLRSKLVSLVALVPLALAGMVAASRVRTNHHFPADVVGGAVLGSSIAAFVHSLWF